MRQTTLFSGLAALVPSAMAYSTPNMLDARQDTLPQDVVCKPETSSGTVPPCVQVESIEAACQPNGTQSIYLEAHAQCICGGSFFAAKLGCERCLYVHGLRSERQLAFYSGVLSSASNALCTGTPTAAFASIYSNAELAATPVTTGATAMSSQAPGNTAVSLYYTPTGPQGPGSITGAAASATKTGGGTTASASEPATTGGATDHGATSSGPRSRTTTAATGTASDDAAATATPSTTDSGAMPTFAAGGLLAGAAGLAVFAGL